MYHLPVTIFIIFDISKVTTVISKLYIELNIVYFRHIKQVQFTYIGPYSKLRVQISKLKVYRVHDLIDWVNQSTVWH